MVLVDTDDTSGTSRSNSCRQPSAYCLLAWQVIQVPHQQQAGMCLSQVHVSLAHGMQASNPSSTIVVETQNIIRDIFGRLSLGFSHQLCRQLPTNQSKQ